MPFRTILRLTVAKTCGSYYNYKYNTLYFVKFAYIFQLWGSFMKNEEILSFLRKILEKRRLHTYLGRIDTLGELPLDLGLRKRLGQQEAFAVLLRKLLPSARHNRVYRYTDRLFCSYFFLLLPDSTEALLAGPYTAFPVTRQHLLEKAEKQNLPPWAIPVLEQFYEQVPVISDSLPLLQLFTTFGEVVWGGAEAFQVEFIEEDAAPTVETFAPEAPKDTPLLDMQVMETRYQFENRLMEMVSRGQVHRVKAFTDALSPKMFESRVADPVRNLKNYCIICNTLLRKAAERGGVHPFYLNRISSDFAARIETLHSQAAGIAFLSEMVRAYCRLVQKHATDSYSPPVRKAVLLIENDLTRDLGLNAVAKELAVSPGYLSSLFKKETGCTFTEFVTRQRMEYGKHLLETTTMQVQTVALHCGIADVNYFSKCFKKHFGVTPRAFRK